MIQTIKQTLSGIKGFYDFRDFESRKKGAKSFQVPPSLAREIRIAEYDHKRELFWLSDAKTPVAMFEIKGIATEGATDEQLKTYRENIFNLISVFPQLTQDESPWIVQMYAKDENDFSSEYQRIVNSIDEELKDTKLTKTYLNLVDKHFDYVTKEEGLFNDTQGNLFRGKVRKVRLVFYRINKKNSYEKAFKEIISIRKAIETRLNTLSSFDVKYKRIDDKEYFEWLFHKFHMQIDGLTPKEYLKKNPFVERKDRAYGYNLVANALAAPIKSNKEKGIWKIGDTYHQFISALALKTSPKIGKTTAELQTENALAKAWLDELPLNTEFYLSFLAISKYDIEKEFEKKEIDAKRSGTLDAQATLVEIEHFRNQFLHKNYVYPTIAGCYISALSEEDLEIRETEVKTSLEHLPYEVLREDYDLDRLDKFVRFLPGNYDYIFDEYYRCSRKTTVEDLASLAPIGYGRTSGAEIPLYIKYNRNGEIRYKNPNSDKKNNRHELTLGTTGSGKSVNQASEIIAEMALIKPYMVIIDAGKSFEFVVDFLESQDLSVNKIEIRMPEKGKLPEVSLNPFMFTKEWLEQHQMLADLRELERELALQEAIEKSENIFVKHTSDNQEEVQELEEVEQRDYIAEFLNSALIIACNGKSMAEACLNDQHKRDLIDVIQELMLEIADQNRQLLPEDIEKRLYEKAHSLATSNNPLERNKAERCDVLYAGFNSFLNNALNRLYFNRQAKPFKVVDVSYFELGIWKTDSESSKASRALAMNNYISQHMSLCEARQNSKRLTKVVIDECHIPLSQDLTAVQITQCAKMSRKIGLDLKLLTQDPADFTGVAYKLLNNFEHYEILSFNDDTVLQNVAKMLSGLGERSLPLARSIKNEKGKYTESLVVNQTRSMLCRNVVLQEPLYMAMNEPNEKQARKEIAKKFNTSEVVAAFIQAQIARGEEPSVEQAIKDLNLCKS
ncbi:TraC family protein [Francisella sp. SYW-9]|uniref:TraC family protein n=1 Tax=Francisella sp. SYW-9 TaxID=2610888 RepID=UPI00123CE264|nr:TraC family protein [Francisella sp. SYW-9]